MKKILIICVVFGFSTYAQLSFDTLSKLVKPYHLGYSHYFDSFVGKTGYGGPWILTSDGGGAAFGDNVFYKFNKDGKEIWKRVVKPKFADETETQVMAEDSKGNFYLFLLQYNHKSGYPGGVERVVCYDKTGKQLWDNLLGNFQSLNNPTISYVKKDINGIIYLRGHIAKEKKTNGDPKYLFWEGWIDSTGKLIQKSGEEIDWSKPEWKTRFSPSNN